MEEEARDPRFKQIDTLIAAGHGDRAHRDNRRVVICNIVFRYADKQPFVKSGKSLLGAIEVSPSGQFKCHECGEWATNLGQHVRAAHRIPAAVYRVTHGLRQKTRLSLRGGKQKLKKRAIHDMALTRTPSALAKARVYQELPRYELRNLRGSCQAQIRADVQKLSAALGRAPTVRELGEKHIRVQHVKQLFEVATFELFLKACGVDFKPCTTGGQKKPITEESRNELAKLIQDKAATNGGTIQATDMRPPLPYPTVFQRVFGSVTKAIEYAGIEMTPHQLGRKK